MSFDAVIKIGGSLSRGEGLPSLCREISRLGKILSLLVVPGGGKFADLVRDADRQYRLGETAAHRMALLAMDQYGYVLNRLIDGSYLTGDLAASLKAARTGRVAILLPSAIVIRFDPLPNSWRVTSDTIAAWIAQEASCPRLVLLKDVDGLIAAENEIIARMTVDELARHSGGVDEYLSQSLSIARLETWVINGNFPERLFQLIDTGCTIGTKIEHGMR
jgi:5-(aminomethyl)-3-furanmethanol phosphate kinase